MMLFAIAEATIFGLAAAISTLVGVGLAIAAHRSSREKATEKANEEQHLQLLEARAEAERLSAELHQLKMKKSGNETSK